MQIALVKVSIIMVANASVKMFEIMYAHSLVVTLNMLHFELSLQMELRHK